MKRAEIEVGGLYTVRLGGRYVTVRVDAVRGDGTAFDVVDTTTGKGHTFHSAARFRGRAEAEQVTPQGEVGQAVESSEVDEDGSEVRAEQVTVVAAPPPSTTAPAMPLISGLASRLAAANSTAIKLTDEQEAILILASEIQAAMRGAATQIKMVDGQWVLIIKAGAGSGKTYELQQLEQALIGLGQYTAYNASLVSDSKPKFKRAACNTTHSLAHRAVGRFYAHKLNRPRMRSHTVAAKLGISDLTLAVGAPYAEGTPEYTEAAEVAGYSHQNPPPKDFCPRATRRLKAGWLAGQVSEAIRRFCTSADRKITARHFKFIEGIDEKGENANNRRVQQYLLPYAERMWDDLTDASGELPFAHDVYVKLWQLGEGDQRPVIAADYIMLDEYQDTAPVMVDILKQQKHALFIMVGDDNQRIYEWRGAINAADEFPGAPSRNLSKSFRFGQTIADVANAVLAGLEEPTDLVMKGFEAIPSRVCKVEEPKCYLYRTNAGAVGRMMRAVANGKKAHLIGGGAEVVKFCEAAIDLQAGRGTDHPELGCFNSWSEVQDYSKEDEGADLRLLVKLIDDFGATAIRDALKNMPKEADAEVVISTAHKSKGREWTSVRLGQDFPLANKLTDADRRLVYVAVTRAQEELDITECPTFCGGLDRQGGGEDGGAEAKWVPGIPITYTVEMPSEADLAAYREAKAAAALAKAPQPAPAAPTPPAPPSQPTPVALPQAAAPAAPAAAATGDYTWASDGNGGWLVRGPAGMTGQSVMVTAKNGSKRRVKLGAKVKQYGDAHLYKVV